MKRRIWAMVGALAAATIATGCDRKVSKSLSKTRSSSVAAVDARSALVRKDAAGKDSLPAPDGASLDAVETCGNDEHFFGELMGARCKRESRCGRIAPGKAYSSFEHCCRVVSWNWGNEPQLDHCTGFLPAAIQACMQHVQGMDCSDEFNRLDMPSICSLSELCVFESSRR